ncbi:MAG: hypothetical protein K0S25_1713 [Bacillus sp. (in: firmicutes)]|jgi:hypothetical protein|nr:hypothetical protein [Bacillus sp. (in: firmicutes)]
MGKILIKLTGTRVQDPDPASQFLKHPLNMGRLHP